MSRPYDDDAQAGRASRVNILQHVAYAIAEGFTGDSHVLPFYVFIRRRTAPVNDSVRWRVISEKGDE